MDQNTITIRYAVHDDLESLVSLLQVLFALEEDFTPDEERQARGLRWFLDGCGKHRTILVAESDRRVVGMATIQIVISTAKGGPVGLVEDVVIDEQYRNRGVGRRLMVALTQWAMDRELSRLQLLADSKNRPALGFYGAMGWEKTQLICLRNRLGRERHAKNEN